MTSACTWQGPLPSPPAGDVHLTLLHTADWHSRLLPYDMTVGQVDQDLGLLQENAPFGGAARITHLLRRERARAARVLHLDAGDCFQGAPIFNFFAGEAEIRALSQSGLDAMVIGNHEFDAGGANFARQIARWATFPALAANYLFEDPGDDRPEEPSLARLAQPFSIHDVDGLRVGVIGIANLSSLNTIFEQPNRLGIVPLETTQVAQFYIDQLRPLVDVIVMLTHSGVTADRRLVQSTSGIDVVLGGHLHVVLQPPAVVRDCARIDADGRHYIEVHDPAAPDAPPRRRFCRPRDVLVVHSGAFLKFLGRLDVVLSRDPARVQPELPPDVDRFPELRYEPALDGHEVVSHRYELFPVDARVPEDPIVAEMLEPYARAIAHVENLDLLVGYAPARVPRFGAQGGDSPLGNLIADAMLLRLGIQTDFALTNTTGIRADISPGPVTAEQMFNVFPFENTVARMVLSGREVQELFDFVARRSAGRGCNAQAQIGGARVELNCAGTGPCDPDGEGPAEGQPCAARIGIGSTQVACCPGGRCDDAICGPRGLCDTATGRCMRPVVADASYELATSNYLAQGGSGFRVLERNTTQEDTGLPMRDVLVDFMRNGAPCGADPVTRQLPACGSDADCAPGFVCACPGRSRWDGARCVDDGVCPPATGRCVLRACRDDVARFVAQDECTGVVDPSVAQRCLCDAAADAGEQCKLLACIDERLGARTDGRIRMRAF
ncbi:MAG: bifunctional UDP-sugar hydrolase/5'-nucleotidase [Myxococcales bacterium]|nr:bifunctional UDP-sugar hydrolase/5'-nucleotidase [Myxococcales bacterium]